MHRRSWNEHCRLGDRADVAERPRIFKVLAANGAADARRQHRARRDSMCRHLLPDHAWT